MIDLKKEIKLSDLVRRPQKKSGAAPAQAPKPAGARLAAEVQQAASSSASRSAPPSSRPRGSSTTARRSCASSRGSPCRAGHRRRAARCATCPRSRRRSTSSSRSTSCPAAASGSGIATNHVGVRSVRDRRHRRRAPARERGAASAPTRPSRSRSTRRSSTTASSARTVDESGAVNRRILLVAAYREPIERYVEAFREAGIQLAGIDLEAFALLRAVGARGDATARGRGRRRRRQRSVTSARRSRSPTAAVCEFTRVLEWGGTKLAAAIARELGITHAPRRSSCCSRSPSQPTTRRTRDDRLAARTRRAVAPRAADARARARRLARVLPGPARLARDLGDPARRRYDADSAASPRSSSG